jgi:hypothetical protein
MVNVSSDWDEEFEQVFCSRECMELCQAKSDSVKHTPGPWRTSHQLGEGFSIVRQKGEGNNLLPVAIAVFTRNYHVENVEVARANARLIAAAPELLQQLQDVLWKLEHFHEFETPERNAFIENTPIHIRAEIAKATEGE